jgi:hypothetical protein
LTLQNKTNWHRETGNTGINTPGANGENRRWVEKITKTGERDQGVTRVEYSIMHCIVLYSTEPIYITVLYRSVRLCPVLYVYI